MKLYDLAPRGKQKNAGNILLVVLVIILAMALMVAQLFGNVSVNERVAVSHIQQIQAFARAQNLLTHCLAALKTENSKLSYIPAAKVASGTLAQKLRSYDKAAINVFSDGGGLIEQMPVYERENTLKHSYWVVAFAYRRHTDGSYETDKTRAVWLQARKTFILAAENNGMGTIETDAVDADERLMVTPSGSEVTVANGGVISQEIKSSAAVWSQTVTIVDNWSSLVYQ